MEKIINLSDSLPPPDKFVIPNNILCPRCESNNLGLAGFIKHSGKRVRRLHCKACDKYFACSQADIPAKFQKPSRQERLSQEPCQSWEHREVWTPPPDLLCPKCNSNELILGGFKTDKRLVKCKKCRHSFCSEKVAHIPKKRTTFSSDITCPRCHSNRIGKGGFNKNNKPMYQCKDCKRRWVIEYDVSDWIPPESLVCPYCQNNDYLIKRGVDAKIPRYFCKSCEKTFVEGYDWLEPICPDCKSRTFSNIGLSAEGYRIYLCLTCNKHYQKDSSPESILLCPFCQKSDNIIKQSNDYSKNYNQGILRYFCRSCEKSFLKGFTLLEPTCPDCKSKSYINLGLSKEGERIYSCRSCNRNYKEGDPPMPKVKSEYIIDIRELNVDYSGITQGYTINIEIIVLPWLRELTLSYIKYRLGKGLAWTTCRDNAQLIKRFGDFLFQSDPNITSVDIDRSVIFNFISSNQYINYAYTVKKKLLFLIRDLFEKAEQFEWAEVSGSTLVYTDDYPSYKKLKPDYIPEEVMEQIMKNLPKLPHPLQRMIFILSEVGMRVAELLHLKFNCLMQDSNGDWFLKYYQFKQKKEHTVPISRECAGMIQAQQQFIREKVSIDWEYLFCGRRTGNFSIWVPKLMSYGSFLRVLKKFVMENNIIDAAGNLWNLHSHQFRHTLATRMINSGMAQHYVQKFLGHESSQMTQVYAHIHDQTLKKEFAKYQGKIVDIAGKIIEERNSDVDNTDLQWFKKNIQAQALPNGSCALPVISQGCPHANACLTCTSFRTTTEFLDQHKQQLKHTEEIIEKARSNGWNRQLEMNEKVAQNLTNIINGLESKNDP